MKKFISLLSALTISMTAISAVNLNAYSADSSKKGYGQGTAVDSNNCPTGALEFNSLYSNEGSYALTNDKSRIIITFDQGYENGYTSKILDTLKEKNVSAIFFLTGDYAKKEKELVNRMIKEGHVLGNHTMNHPSLPDLSPDKLKEEIMSLHEYVLKEYGYEMQYFRYPCGEYSESTIQALKSMGYKTLFWSFAYVDWKTDSQPDPSFGLKKLTESAHGGEILLLHSVSSTNAQILGDVIDNLREQGYRV